MSSSTPSNPVAATSSPRPGRPTGKSADPRWRSVTHHMERQTHIDAQVLLIALRMKGILPPEWKDMSTLINTLVAESFLRTGAELQVAVAAASPAALARTMEAPVGVLDKRNKNQARMLHYAYGAFALAVGLRTRRLREESGIVEAEMEARRATQWERVETAGKITLHDLFTVAKMLGISVRELLRGTEPEP